MSGTLCADALTEVIDDLSTNGKAVGDSGEIVEIGSFAITAAAGAILESAARAITNALEKPPCMIEIGCASALSTLHICRGMLEASGASEGCVHVIDPKQTTHWKNIGRRNIMRAELDEHVHFHEIAAHEALPTMVRQLQSVQFAFIDGWHMLDYIMVEAFYIDFMLDVGGVIAIHGLWMPGLQQFASFWMTNRGYEPVTIIDGAITTEPVNSENPNTGDAAKWTPHFREHIAPFIDESILFLRKTSKDDRAWDAYEDFIGA